MGFGIDRDGKAFYTVDMATIYYPEKEKVKLPNGKTITREVIREYKPEPVKKTPEECGWRKIVQFEDVVLLDVANPKNHGKLEKQLFHRIYEIDMEKYYNYHKCDICEANGIGSKHHYFRVMPSGVFTVCWVMASKFGRTASGPIQTVTDREGSTAPWVKLVSELAISKKDAKVILRRLQKTPNLDVSMYLNDFEVV